MFPNLAYASASPSAPKLFEDQAINPIVQISQRPTRISLDGISTDMDNPVPTLLKLTNGDTYKPPKFDGISANAYDWLELFHTAADANEWDKKTRLLKLPLFLDGTALQWYINRVKRAADDNPDSTSSEVTPEEKLKIFEEKLKQAFPSSSTATGAFQKMIARNQQIGEPYSQYMTSKLSLIHQYNPITPEKEKVTLVLQGSLPSIFEDLYPLQCKTLDELERQAILHSEKKSLSNTRNTVNAITMTPEILQEVALIATRQQQTQRNNDNCEHGINRERQRLSERTRDARQRTSPPQTSREQGENRTNYQRPMREITCFNCGRRGHMRNQCWSRQVRFGETPRYRNNYNNGNRQRSNNWGN